MDKKADYYRKCHKELEELYKCRQKPFIDKEIENRLLQDGAIKKNGLDAQITPQGDDYVHNKYYLELAEKADCEERERELRERDSLMNQMAVEKADEQNKINRQMLLYHRITIVFSGIAALGTIIGLIKGCN